MTTDDLRDFVAGALGCQCPPEVLADIADETGLAGGPFYVALRDTDATLPPLVDRIISVGGRLLVLITRADDQETLRSLLASGERLTEALGFRRLRLAVFDARLEADAAGELHCLCSERQHIHFLRSEEGRR